MIIVYLVILKPNLNPLSFLLIFKTMDWSWDLATTRDEINRRSTVGFHNWSSSE